MFRRSTKGDSPLHVYSRVITLMDGVISRSKLAPAPRLALDWSGKGQE
jgi:hypothetical protein